MTDSGRFENPSAGRFEPPPGRERFDAPKPRRSPQWLGALFLLSLWIARFALDRVHTRGWMAALVGLGVLGIGAADYVFRRKLHDARRADGGDPYTPPPQITR